MNESFHPPCLSAFTGAGGLDLGLEAAGFETVGCIESNPEARETIQLNRPQWNVLDPPDIAEVASVLRPRDLGVRKRSLGILAGGPPCQPFSKAAQYRHDGRSGLEDSRSSCLSGFIRLVREFLPRVLLIENVPGFVTVQNQRGAIPRTLPRKDQSSMRHSLRVRLPCGQCGALRGATESSPCDSDRSARWSSVRLAGADSYWQACTCW